MVNFNFWKNIGNKKFRSNFIYSVNVSVVSQVLLLISSPILSRLYEPTNFGILALYTSITTILVSFSTLRFDWSIPNSANNKVASSLFINGIIILIFSVLLITLLIVIFGKKILPSNYINLHDYIFLIPLGLLGLGLHQLYHGWYVMISDLKTVGNTRIFQSIGNILLSVFLGITFFDESGLIIASFFSSWLGISIFIKKTPILIKWIKSIDIRYIYKTFRKFYREALLSTGVSTLNILSHQSIVLLIALTFGIEKAGLVLFAQRITLMPIRFVANALSNSFWSHAANLAKKKKYKKLQNDYKKIIIILSIFSILISIAVFVIQPFITPIFGEKWKLLGVTMLCLLPTACGTAIVSSTNHLIVFNSQALQLAVDLSRLVLVSSSIILSGFFKLDFELALLLAAFCSAFSHLILFIIHWYVQSSLIKKFS